MGHQPGLRWDVGPQPGGQSWWEVLQEPVTPAPDSTLTTPASDHSSWLVTGTTLPGKLCIYTARAPSGHPWVRVPQPFQVPLARAAAIDFLSLPIGPQADSFPVVARAGHSPDWRNTTAISPLCMLCNFTLLLFKVEPLYDVERVAEENYASHVLAAAITVAFLVGLFLGALPWLATTLLRVCRAKRHRYRVRVLEEESEP